MVQEMLDNLKKRLHSQNEAAELTIVVSGGKKYTSYLAQTCGCVWISSMRFKE